MLYYNTSFEIAGIIMLGVILAFLHVQYSVATRSSKAFARLVFLVLVAEVFDVISGLCCANYVGIVPQEVAGLTALVYFVVSFVAEYLLMNYIRMHCENARVAKVTKVSDTVFLIIALIIAISTPMTGALFYFNGNVYTHGALHFVAYVLPFYYICSATAIVLDSKDRFSQKELTSYLGFVVVFALGALVQGLLAPDVMLSAFGASIGVLILLFGLETADYPALMKAMGELEELKSSLEVQVLEQTTLANERQRKVQHLSQETVQALAHTIDAKDGYTNGHSVRVSVYAMQLARELGWSEERVEVANYAALLHDIGKIGIPDSILNKPEKLDEAEYKVIQSHTIFGSNILKGISSIPEIGQVARWHHERWDGMGYPDGLAGQDIPQMARLIALADCYDAMSSRRVYRDAYPEAQIRRELERGLGSQFDPEMGKVFIKLFDEGRLVPGDDNGDDAAA